MNTPYLKYIHFQNFADTNSLFLSHQQPFHKGKASPLLWLSNFVFRLDIFASMENQPVAKRRYQRNVITIRVKRIDTLIQYRPGKYHLFCQCAIVAKSIGQIGYKQGFSFTGGPFKSKQTFGFSVLIDD